MCFINIFRPGPFISVRIKIQAFHLHVHTSINGVYMLADLNRPDGTQKDGERGGGLQPHPAGAS